MSKDAPFETRCEEFRTDIRRYDALIAVAIERQQCSAAVQAGKARTQAERALRALLIAREISEIKDPVRRLERIRQEAVAGESHVAAAQLGRQIEEARAKQDAEREARAEARKKKPAVMLSALAATIAAMPDKMREQLYAAVEERRRPRPPAN